MKSSEAVKSSCASKEPSSTYMQVGKVIQGMKIDQDKTGARKRKKNILLSHAIFDHKLKD